MSRGETARALDADAWMRRPDAKYFGSVGRCRTCRLPSEANRACNDEVRTRLSVSVGVNFDP